MKDPTINQAAMGGTFHYDKHGKLIDFVPSTDPPKGKSELLAEKVAAEAAAKTASVASATAPDADDTKPAGKTDAALKTVKAKD
jgi:hypothetical protein